MCGISGFVHFDSNKPASYSAAQRMSRAIAHRGPDEQGIFVKNNIALAHQRLAIIDVSSGHQPMVNADDSIVLTFNGEIYNYVELRDELRSLGHRFATASDTEVLLHAYEEWGTTLHDKLNGMWAFAIWDGRKKLLFISRDRLGEKPLFFSQHVDTFVFASELKSLLAYGVPRNANLEVLELYLTLGYVPAPLSFVRNIYKLLPGHYAIVEKGQFKSYRYWDLPSLDERDMLQDREQVYEEFRALFYDAVRLRMRSDVSYGAFLSGGLDSASVVSVMAQIHSQPVDTFTVGFPEEQFDETPLARKIADQFKTRHHEFLVKSECFEDSLNLILHHYDEPFGDSAAIPTGYISKCASKSVKMVLTGDGGDEVLSGYNAYQSEKFAAQYQKYPKFFRELPLLGLNCLRHVCSTSQQPKLNQIKRILLTSSLDLNSRLITKAAWAERDIIKHLLRPHSNDTIPIDSYITDFMAGCSYRDNFYRLMYYHTKLTLPDRMLTKVDRMSMAYSLEARMPFLDHRLVEFLSRVDKRVKMKGYERKSILRRTIAKDFPYPLLKSRKRGFVVPLREWLKDPSLVAALPQLLDRAHLGMDRTAVNELIRKNATGEADYGNFLWMLFLLGKWL